jgi:hypothetical protein
MDHFTTDPTLQLWVEYPRSRETGTYTVGLADGCTPGRKDRSTGEQLLAFSVDVLAPFEFSGIPYDPLASMAASVARLAPETRPTGSPGGPGDCIMALWAAFEADLYRFAKDPGFTAAVDGAAKEQPGEYRRFARLNDLYRDMVELLVPHGLAPRRWTAWLRGDEYHPLLPLGLALRIEGFLAGRFVQPEEGMDSMTRLLARYGALLMMPLS